MPRYFYRSDRGGLCRLSPDEQVQFLELYDDLQVPMSEVAEIFGLSTSTAYHYLALLGVKPHSKMTASEYRAFEARRQDAVRARRGRGNVVPLRLVG